MKFPSHAAADLATLALAAAPAPAANNPAPKTNPREVTLKTVRVGAPGNPAVAIVPFSDAIYKSCDEAPNTPAGCQAVGGVTYGFGIGELEITVAQYVAFLNTADPGGTNEQKLYSSTESSSAWPRFGQIDFSAKGGPGRHYSVASPEWAEKPYGFANFLRSARFANSLSNGKVLSKKTTAEAGWNVTSYKVRLSPETETGMYDMGKRAPRRTAKSGFVVPSQDEWIKAAYYDPNGGGTYSYWKYPTNAGVFGDKTATAPAPATLDPSNGNVTNAATTQPLAIYHQTSKEKEPPVPAPSWCPATQSAEACAIVNPFGLDSTLYGEAFQGSLGTVGQALTRSPWGTLDQGGNVVEWTDTITSAPFGTKGVRVWRRLHGGIANAPVYQLWLSAVGLQPQENNFFTATYPWLGIRVGVLGNPLKRAAKPNKR
jgi:hypothetical protein